MNRRSNNYILTDGGSFPSAKILRDALVEKNGLRVLVTKNPERIKEKDLALIRYGNSSAINGMDTDRNSREFIQYCANKLNFNKHGVVEEIKYNTPVFNRGSLPENYPVLIRESLTSSGGAGIILCRNEEEFIQNHGRNCFWTSFVKTACEYRVHVVEGKIIKVFKKVREENLEEEEFPIRNLHRGYHFSLCNPEKFVKLQKVIDDIALEGAFYALDCGWIPENQEFFLFEVNSAPGLNKETAQLYVDNLF